MPNMDFEWQIDEFMVDCRSRQLRPKTMSSYEQALRLFARWCKEQMGITDVSAVTESMVRRYINDLQERGKYTTCADDRSLEKNFPERRRDFRKPVSVVTINCYIRDIRVFFNWLDRDYLLTKNPMKKIKQLKTNRKAKEYISDADFKHLINNLDKYDYELSLPESIKADRITLLTTYKKALEILAPIDKVLDPILKDKKPCEIEFTLAIDRRRKMLRLLGMLRNAFLAAGSMSIFVLLYLYKLQPISSKVPNFLTVLSFGLVFLVYALRGQAEEALDEAEKYVRETISESEESMANERIHIKRIEAAMCPEPITLQKDADARILIFLMNIIGADDVGEP